VPTLTEQGYPNTDCDNWYGLLAPAKTPAAIIAKLNAAMRSALTDPVVKEKLVKVGAVPTPSTPEEFESFLREELARWGKVIREKGITVK
jgi:tripartite-type tricarboxylate transporter receptor subunit TctC